MNASATTDRATDEGPMPRSLLVTGGAGFIGANLVRYWAAAHPADRLIVLDALTYAGNYASISDLVASGAARFVKADIGDVAAVSALLREERVDTIVHLAAESHVDRSIHGPEAFVDTNVTGTHRLLIAARSAWLESPAVTGPVRFHHVSTDEVFGSLAPGEAAFTERTAYAPNSPYAASKAASDHLVRAYHHTYGLPVTISNSSNNYGPYQFPEKLLPLILVNCLEGHSLPIYGDGMQRRDWIHVADHCRGIEAVLARGRVGENYNIGGNAERANLEMVRLLCAAVDRAFAADAALAKRFPRSPAARGERCEGAIAFVADRPGHDRRYAVDAKKIQRELNFAPMESLEDGLQGLVEWYLAHEPWWRAVQDGSYQDWMALQYGRLAGSA